ncbi:HotDog domain-containing protein [Blakeslea trispora]|nr:HotDog domain-containing protein [Blakeslea trispora]
MTAIDTSVRYQPKNNQIYQQHDCQDKLADQENDIQLIKELRQSDEWHEVVAYEHLSDSARSHSLTATTLRGDKMVARRPIKFFNRDKTACVMAIHFGANLCGHDGIVHGGMAATVLDEMLAYVTIPSLPGHSGFTANLNVDYRKPIMSDQWVIVHGELERLEGRKAWGKARIETVGDEPVVLTEATALYISPRAQGPVTKF